MPSVIGPMIADMEAFPFTIRVTEDIMRPYRAPLIAVRWPDGYAMLFQGDPCMIEDTEFFRDLMANERRRLERHPLALWCNWEWYE